MSGSIGIKLLRPLSALLGVGIAFASPFAWREKAHQAEFLAAKPLKGHAGPFSKKALSVEGLIDINLLALKDKSGKLDWDKVRDLEGEKHSMSVKVFVWPGDFEKQNVGHTAMNLVIENKKGEEVSLGYLSLWPAEGVVTFGPTKALPLPAVSQTYHQDMEEERNPHYTVTIPVEGESAQHRCVGAFSEKLAQVESGQIRYQLLFLGVAAAISRELGLSAEVETHGYENPFSPGGASRKAADFFGELEKMQSSSAGQVDFLKDAGPKQEHQCASIGIAVLRDAGLFSKDELSLFERVIGAPTPGALLRALEKAGFEVTAPAFGVERTGSVVDPDRDRGQEFSG